MKRIKFLALLAATVLALSACGPQPQLPVPSLDGVAQQAPVVQGNDGYGAGTIAAAALGGAVLGHMVGKRNNTTVVHHAPAPAPYYGGGYGYGRKTVTTTTTRRSFGGRTVTRTVTRRR